MLNTEENNPFHEAVYSCRVNRIKIQVHLLSIVLSQAGIQVFFSLLRTVSARLVPQIQSLMNMLFKRQALFPSGNKCALKRRYLQSEPFLCLTAIYCKAQSGVKFEHTSTVFHLTGFEKRSLTALALSVPWAHAQTNILLGHERLLFKQTVS